MNQIKVSQERRIEFELGKDGGQLYNVLKPMLFEDDKLYCCVLGPDLKFGIKGFGHTPIDAVEDWEVSIRKRITNPLANDQLANYISKTLKAKKQ